MAPCQSDLARLPFGSLNRSIEWVGGNFPSAVSGWCWRISNGLSSKRTHEVQTGHYALTAGDLRSPSKQQEEVQHSHPLSLRTPPTSYTNLSHTHIENTHTHTHLAVSLLRLHWFALFSRLWKISKALKTNKQQYSISLLVLNTHTQKQWASINMFWCNTLKQCHLYNLILYFKTLEAVWTKLD